jgi:hypothetical protein
LKDREISAVVAAKLRNQQFGAFGQEGRVGHRA